MYYPKTTYSQRKLLFEVWEKTGNASKACREAHVSEGTYYCWKERFSKEGYEGLKNNKKTGPEKGMWTTEEIKAKVVELKKENEDWGKRRIADELSKKNSWVAVVSANTVRRILEEAGMWTGVVREAKKKEKRKS